MKLNALKKPNAAGRTYGHTKLKLIGAAIAGALVCCSALAVVSAARRHPLPAKAAATASAESQAGSAASSGPVEVVRFALYDVGIYPQEAHASKGLIAISFDDMSGAESELVIERDTGTALQSVGRARRADHYPRGRTDLKLGPGRYKVYMADRPDNQATLIVEP